VRVDSEYSELWHVEEIYVYDPGSGAAAHIRGNDGVCGGDRERGPAPRPDPSQREKNWSGPRMVCFGIVCFEKRR
jgi:hypothetical protein